MARGSFVVPRRRVSKPLRRREPELGKRDVRRAEIGTSIGARRRRARLCPPRECLRERVYYTHASRVLQQHFIESRPEGRSVERRETCAASRFSSSFLLSLFFFLLFPLFRRVAAIRNCRPLFFGVSWIVAPSTFLRIFWIAALAIPKNVKKWKFSRMWSSLYGVRQLGTAATRGGDDN